jgi:hypothetical protein
VSVKLAMTQFCRRIIVTSDVALKLTWCTSGVLKRVEEHFAFRDALPSFLVAGTMHFYRCFECVDLESHPIPPLFLRSLTRFEIMHTMFCQC